MITSRIYARAHLPIETLVDPDEKIDWFRVIVDLERAGYKHALIALSVDAPRTTLIGWKQGATPKWDDGERLIALWVRVTGKCRETVHRVKRYSHLA